MQLKVRFYDPAKLAPHIIELYSDYLVSDEMGAVASPECEAKSLEDFVTEAFGFLLYDAAKNRIVITTTDEWTRENTIANLDALGLEPA